MDAKRLRDILGSGPGVTGESGSRSEPDERLMSAEAVLRAVRKDDAEALDLALEDHYRACRDEAGSDEDGEDDAADPSSASDREYGMD